MSLEADIADWANARPGWQRSTLIRLCRGEILDDADAAVIADQLIAGFVDDPPAIVAVDIPGPAASPTSVRLLSVGDFTNINALPTGETLTFAPTGLTVVYGQNASGKSGYARLLKSVAAARHREEILGDVYLTSPSPQGAVVRLNDGSTDSEWSWPGESTPLLRQIAFYDEHCGDSYVSTEYEVTYRPSALTLLDHLIEMCGRVRTELDVRAVAISRSRQAVPAVPPVSSAAAFLTSLSGDTTTDELDAACAVPQKAEDDLGRLLQEEARLRASDPAKERTRLLTVGATATRLADHCAALARELGEQAQQQLHETRDRVTQRRAAAAVASSTTFDAEPVRGVGSDTWRTLWDAARAFSEQEAYHDHVFPVVDDAARCVLCHQDLDAIAADRLTRFHAAMQDQTQEKARDAERELAGLIEAMSRVEPLSAQVSQALSDIPATDAAPARAWIEHAIVVKQRLIGSAGQPAPDEVPWPADPAPVLQSRAAEAITAANDLDDTQFATSLHAATMAKDELQGRITLAQHRTALVGEVDRLAAAQQIEIAKRATDTTSITRRATELARSHVTDVVRDRFTRECDRLKLERVTLSDVGGKKGQLRHRSSLLNAARDATVKQVLSEGEQTALGLAGFLTEAYFDGSKSALVFDDPVTSLDHVRRWEVASRLVEFAKDRQVIVFTHDVSFVGDLSRAAKRQQVALIERSIERTGDDHPGKTADQHPWNVKDVDARLGHLLQDLARIKRDRGNWAQSQYEQESGEWAGKLSQLWERMISMEIVNYVVDRATTQVQPRMFRVIARITPTDDNEFQISYENCSFWATRHDKNPERNYVAPTIDELDSELATVKAWFKRIKSYRN